MSTTLNIKKSAGKALLSGGLALGALALTTGTAHANPFVNGPLPEPCGGYCGHGHHDIYRDIFRAPHALLHDLFDYKEGGRN
jgi:hypothetical protein